MSTQQLKIVAAQINTAVGNVEGNVERIRKAWADAEKQGADLVVTPELSLSGYPLEDLVNNPDLLEASRRGLAEIVETSKTMKSAILVGLPWKDDDGLPYNSAVLVENGKVTGPIHKHHLPNYDVFDEKRNFSSGGYYDPVDFRGVKLGVMICEDTWYPDVSKNLADKGAQLLVSMNASPFEVNKIDRRFRTVVGERVNETGLPMIYVNQVGGQDEIVFDGGSMAVNPDGTYSVMPMFEETGELLTVNIDKAGKAAFDKGPMSPVPPDLEQIWCALVTGTRDYLAKTGHKKVVLGMSGGIDSAVVAAVAADAIGPENVRLVSMPYKYTSSGTRNDARDAAALLGSPFEELPIKDAVEGLHKALGTHFNENSEGTANENDQARVRGNILMHISNEEPGMLVLSTGNKSEVSVGYCTLYGDMNGGFNPLKDVGKIMVYELARWRNKHYVDSYKGPKGPVMPDTVITRKPSAELAPGQIDENNLPPYEILDEILERYVVNGDAMEQIAADIKDEVADYLKTVTRYGSAEDLVRDMVHKVDVAEFKRQQACPGVKISQRSFGRGRRMPIARPPLPKMAKGMGF